jgi:hypothetical protein
MEMMDCPHCGTQNSVKRDYCYQCGGELQGEPNTTADLEYIPTCANCARAAISPPAGQGISPDQVWCMERDEAVGSAQMAGDCFAQPFGWKREDILD